MSDTLTTPAKLDQENLTRAAHTIRGLSMDGVQRAGSGHPGMPMGMADIAAVLWTKHMRHNPKDPGWPDRDRFVLSAGHGSMLLYSLLHLTGYDMPMEELKNFRQWGSKTAGHPENFLAEGIETTTGPLGQGISNAAGMALAERHLAARYNRPGYEIVSHYTYVIASDGDMMEGVTHESAAIAGHLGLGRLIVFYDDNGITIDGETELSFSENVVRRFDAYGWHTQQIDGHDLEAIDAAIEEARDVTDRPSMIACKTTIGFGSPNRAGTAKAHGEPLGEDEVRLAKERLGLPPDKQFHVAADVRKFMLEAVEKGAALQSEWEDLMEAYTSEHSDAAKIFRMSLDDEFPAGWDERLVNFEPGTSMATRSASGKVIEALVKRVPHIVGGSADLTPSNKTKPDENFISNGNYGQRYIHYGVREHGMGSMMNGMSLHGGIRPFGGTFLIFSDYMRASIRLAALMKRQVIYVFTHDSIGIGEDGPTHQPVEHLPSLRAIPNLAVMRPGDATETVEAWKAALNWNGPVAMALTRQNLPTLDRSKLAPAEGVLRGAYTVAEDDDARLILIGTGSELQIALDARELLREDGIASRVVSMPCWELFEAQSEEYKQSVFPADIPLRVAVEAAVPLGWERYVGARGLTVGINRFGASAPYQRVYEELGITAENVAREARSLVNK